VQHPNQAGGRKTIQNRLRQPGGMRRRCGSVAAEEAIGSQSRKPAAGRNGTRLPRAPAFGASRIHHNVAEWMAEMKTRLQVLAIAAAVCLAAPAQTPDPAKPDQEHARGAARRRRRRRSCAAS